MNPINTLFSSLCIPVILFMFYSDHYAAAPYIRNDSVAYAPGEIVVAKFTEDDAFYRARVVDSDFDNYRVQVSLQL